MKILKIIFAAPSFRKTVDKGVTFISTGKEMSVVLSTTVSLYPKQNSKKPRNIILRETENIYIDAAHGKGLKDF